MFPDILLNTDFCARHHTVSSSSSCRENVERRDMLDSEWSDRTEMAESDLRGVPIGGWGDGRRQWRGDVMCYSYINSTWYINMCWILCTSSIIIVHTKLMIKCEVWDSLTHNRFIFKSSASVSLIINGNELEILNLLGGAGKTLNVKRCVWKRVYHPIVIIPGRVGESAGGGGSSSVLFIAAGRFCWKHTLKNINSKIMEYFSDYQAKGRNKNADKLKTLVERQIMCITFSSSSYGWESRAKWGLHLALQMREETLSLNLFQ